MASSLKVLPLLTKAEIERSFRPFIPVESFVEDKVKPVIADVPNIGIRWGKPADFEFDLSTQKRGYSIQVDHSGSDDEPERDEEGDIKPVEKPPLEPDEEPDETDDPEDKVRKVAGNKEFVNEIRDFSEQWRSYRTGDVYVRVEEPIIYENWGTQMTHLRQQGYEDYTVELEELVTWLANSGVVTHRLDDEGNIIRNTTIYYEFSFDPYIPFVARTIKHGVRGVHPDPSKSNVE